MNEIRIFPYQCPEQETMVHDLVITHNPDIQTFIDYWGNKTGTFNVLIPHQELVIESKLVIKTLAPSNTTINFESTWQQLQDEVSAKLQLVELSKPILINQPDEIDAIVKVISAKDETVGVTIGNCSDYIFKNFQYIKGITNIETTVDEILNHKAGVCQDFAHLMLQILRTLNIPCRYVSGYICPSRDGMRGEGATHAWVDAWIPDHGWAGIDPTNNVWVTNNHVKLAVGSEFKDCTPAKGTFKGPAHQLLSVYVSVGYEDGHVFEEINDVKMETSTSTGPVKDIPVLAAGQQQQ
jgi:transglutaminase-like putative cysteine protease